jgi:hypothetical protein
MENIFLIAGVIAVIFLIFKFVESKYIEQEPKPLKYLIRDSLLVYISVICGDFIISQISPSMNTNMNGGSVSDSVPLQIFTDQPGF